MASTLAAQAREAGAAAQATEQSRQRAAAAAVREATLRQELTEARAAAV
jgi:hypothetical protein